MRALGGATASSQNGRSALELTTQDSNKSSGSTPSSAKRSKLMRGLTNLVGTVAVSHDHDSHTALSTPRLVVKPRREETDGESHAAWLELFNDLLYVAILVMLSHTIKDVTEERLNLEDSPVSSHIFGLHVICFCLHSSFFFIWLDLAMFFNIFTARGGVANIGCLLLFVAEMTGTFIMMLSLGSHLTKTSSYLVRWEYTLLGLMISRASNLLQWWMASSTRAARASPIADHLKIIWRVKVICVTASFAMYLGLSLRNVGRVDHSPLLPNYAECFIALGLLAIPLVEASPRLLYVIDHDKSHGDQRGGDAEKLMGRMKEYMMLLLGEPLISLGVSSNSPE